MGNFKDLGRADHKHAQSLDDIAHKDDGLAIHSSREEAHQEGGNHKAARTESVDERNQCVTHFVVAGYFGVQVGNVEYLPEYHNYDGKIEDQRLARTEGTASGVVGHSGMPFEGFRLIIWRRILTCLLSGCTCADRGVCFFIGRDYPQSEREVNPQIDGNENEERGQHVLGSFLVKEVTEENSSHDPRVDCHQNESGHPFVVVVEVLGSQHVSLVKENVSPENEAKDERKEEKDGSRREQLSESKERVEERLHKNGVDEKPSAAKFESKGACEKAEGERGKAGN